jgi:hypothetical protein
MVATSWENRLIIRRATLSHLPKPRIIVRGLRGSPLASGVRQWALGADDPGLPVLAQRIGQDHAAALGNVLAVCLKRTRCMLSTGGPLEANFCPKEVYTSTVWHELHAEVFTSGNERLVQIAYGGDGILKASLR